MYNIKTLSNFPTETGISTQNFRIAKSMSDTEVNFFKYSLESVHKPQIQYNFRFTLTAEIFRGNPAQPEKQAVKREVIAAVK